MRLFRRVGTECTPCMAIHAEDSLQTKPQFDFVPIELAIQEQVKCMELLPGSALIGGVRAAPEKVGLLRQNFTAPDIPS